MPNEPSKPSERPIFDIVRDGLIDNMTQQRNIKCTLASRTRQIRWHQEQHSSIPIGVYVEITALKTTGRRKFARVDTR